jgi:spore maturation protein CgeB
MNSVSQSQTMFARRAFEMLASNTVTVGNYSRGMKNYFGDLTLCTNDSATLKKLLGKYCSDEETYRKYRLLGLRKVLSEHLYEDRLS